MKLLLPGDLKLKEFGRRLRGLDSDEVRAFLLEIAGYWEEALQIGRASCRERV